MAQISEGFFCETSGSFSHQIPTRIVPDYIIQVMRWWREKYLQSETPKVRNRSSEVSNGSLKGGIELTWGAVKTPRGRYRWLNQTGCPPESAWSGNSDRAKKVNNNRTTPLSSSSGFSSSDACQKKNKASERTTQLLLVYLHLAWRQRLNQSRNACVCVDPWQMDP